MGVIRIRGCLAVFAVLLCGCTAGIRGASPGGDLVANPGFEEDSGPVPRGWLLENRVKQRGAVALDREVRHGGNASLRLSPNRRNTQGDNPFGVGQQFRVSNVDGKRLRVEAALRVRGGATAALLVFAVAGNGRFIGTAHLQKSDPGSDFTVERNTLEVPGGTQSIIVGCAALDTSGEVWFDDIFVGLEDEAPAAAASQQEAGVVEASISIDAGRAVKNVDRTIYGTNVDWIYDAHGLADPNTGRATAAALKLARDLGVGLVRFPGGVLADYYRWRSGTSPVRSRPVLPHVVDAASTRNTFGTHELIEFCRDIGAEPLLQVNVITGSAEEAADWVAYCNRPNHPERARNGSPEPFGVRLWEIGNEQYMKHEKQTEKSYLPPDEYISRFLAYAAAMKRVDPSIRVGAVSGVNFGNYSIVHDGDWNRRLLQRAGDRIDWLSVHNAYAPAVVNHGGASFDEVYKALLAFPKLLEGNLETLNRDIERYAPGAAANMRIGVTEWGPLFALAGDSPWVGHTKTLGSALFVASVVNVLLRAPRVDVAAFFKLAERNIFIGWVDQRGVPKATYYALQMYARRFGDRVVSADVQSPTYRSASMGVVASVGQVPYIDAVAAVSEDGSRLYINAVNKHFTSPVKAKIALRGFNPRSVAETWVLTAPSLDANNGDDLPRVAGAKWAQQARAPRAGMIDQGRPDTVVPRRGKFQGAATTFEYEFSPMSVTSVVLTRK